MNLWQFEQRGTIQVNAPIERVYDTAVDPALVPSFVPEVTKIEPIKMLSNGQEIVRSHIRIVGITRPYLYRYTYRRPHSKSGIQEGTSLITAFFTLSFTAQDGGTLVVHTEGIKSKFPGLAPLVGWIYFRYLAPAGIDNELSMLKRLVEDG